MSRKLWAGESSQVRWVSWTLSAAVDAAPRQRPLWGDESGGGRPPWLHLD
ncbi:hypothetical protein ACIF83_19840 [Streptomyces sp. NPDC085866]